MNNYTEIIITYYKDSSTFHQIAFLINGIYDTVETFDLKYHCKYLNLEITKFKEIH